VNKLLLKLSMTATVGCLLWASPTLAQMPAPKAQNVQITKQPSLEIAYDDVCIISWDTNNPGGPPDQFAVVHYGEQPNALTQTAQSHIRLNQGRPDTRWRVRITGLKPNTHYFYTVTSKEANGTGSGPQSSLGEFTTPPPGQRIQPPG
jgi:phosphodiesterase/alkaline phosphatase D-like protein